MVIALIVSEWIGAVIAFEARHALAFAAFKHPTIRTADRFLTHLTLVAGVTSVAYAFVSEPHAMQTTFVLFAEAPIETDVTLTASSCHLRAILTHRRLHGVTNATCKNIHLGQHGDIHPCEGLRHKRSIASIAARVGRSCTGM
jgi:hypothetical protein